MTTAAELAEYVGSPNPEEPALDDALATADALVSEYIYAHEDYYLYKEPAPVEIHPTSGVPQAVKDRAVLEVAAELYHRKNTKNGIAQFAVPDMASPIRIARDPMVAAYPILNRFLMRGGLA